MEGAGDLTGGGAGGGVDLFDEGGDGGGVFAGVEAVEEAFGGGESEVDLAGEVAVNF